MVLMKRINSLCHITMSLILSPEISRVYYLLRQLCNNVIRDLSNWINMASIYDVAHFIIIISMFTK